MASYLDFLREMYPSAFGEQTADGPMSVLPETPQSNSTSVPSETPQNNPMENINRQIAQEELLSKLSVPKKPTMGSSPAEQNLRQAEQAMQEEKDLDAQLGSEGYEKKQDGIFDRLKGWGTSVGEYLFGKEKSSIEQQVNPYDTEALKAASLKMAADDMVNRTDAANEDRLKDEQGALGYYGSKILGKQGLQEWENFKNDWNERGIGAVTERTANLMDTMARSPYASMVDPTTVLGGQRTMVNDIDSYFDKRGLGALRNDLMKQDMLNNQTLLGQAKQYANSPPEEQAAMEKYMKMRYPNRATGSLSSVKNEDNMRAKLWNDFYTENGRAPYADEWSDIKRTHGLDTLDKEPTLDNLNKYAIWRALDKYRADPERYGNDPDNALMEQYDTMARDPNLQSQLLRQGSYQPKTADEKVVTAQREGFAKAYAPRLSKELEEVESDTYKETLRNLESFYKFLNDPRNANYLQGPFNNVIQGYASKLGIASAEQEAFLAAFLSAQRDMHAVAIRQINQSGATNREEQRKAAESIIDMSKGLDYNKSLVKKTISNMALAQAMKRDEYYLAEAGGDKRSNDALLRKKYGAMIHDPNKYIDPAIVDRYLGEDGVFAYSPSVGSYVFGTEE